MNPPGLDDDTTNGTQHRTVYALLRAHEAYWSDPANVDHLRHLCANDPQAVTNRRKVKPSDVVHVLRVLATTAAFTNLTANLTLAQIATRTLLSEPKVRDSIRVARIADLITNVTKAQIPTGRRPGRAPRRRLDYLIRALEPIEGTTPTVGSTSSPNSAETTSKSADSRIALTTTALHKTSEPATFDNSSSSRTAPNDWERTFRQTLIDEIATATSMTSNAVSRQFGPRIGTTLRQAYEEWPPRGAPPADRDLARYYADKVRKDNGNMSTWHILQERYPATTSPPT